MVFCQVGTTKPTKPSDTFKLLYTLGLYRGLILAEHTQAAETKHTLSKYRQRKFCIHYHPSTGQQFVAFAWLNGSQSISRILTIYRDH